MTICISLLIMISSIFTSFCAQDPAYYKRHLKTMIQAQDRTEKLKRVLENPSLDNPYVKGFQKLFERYKNFLLFDAVNLNDEKFVKFLLDKGADVNTRWITTTGRLGLDETFANDNPISNPDGYTPITLAYTPEMITFLVDHGADLDVKYKDYGAVLDNE